MPFISTIQDTAYAWMPRWFLVMMLVSSIGSAVLFLLTIRASGKKGYLFLAVAAALPSLLYVKTTIEEKIRQALTLIGAVMLYRSEKSRANSESCVTRSRHTTLVEQAPGIPETKAKTD
ncbi:MAG: hypothetical protein IPL39_19105 [Opitutaceae bacterium]|nr:hypothetical protein [Opitutaceae bacterium]